MEPPDDRDLGEVELGECAVLVVEKQLDLAVRGWRPGGRPGEEHVVGLLRPQLARREAAGGPDQRVGDVRLAGAVRPHHDRDAGLEADLDRVGKRLEAAELDRTHVHAGAEASERGG
jgi:hypothetical protein